MNRTLTSFFIIFLPFVLHAQQWRTLGVQDHELVELRTALASMHTITGDIRQEKAFAFLTDKLVSEGQFYFSDQNKLRWQFSRPMEYIILINGNSMRLKEAGEEKKYKGMDRILRQVKEIILGCIDGSIMDNPDYRAEISTDGTVVRMRFQPKAKNLKEFIDRIEVQFLRDGSTLEKLTLVDPSGDRTDIYFSNIRTNQPIDESVFVDL